MGVSIEIKKKKYEERDYPWIGISEDDIVYFYDPCDGIVLYSKGGNYLLGDHLNSPNMEIFKTFTGKIIIENAS